MPTPSLPVISLGDAETTVTSRLGESLREYGFALVCDHGIDPALIAKAWRLTAQVFALPDAEKQRYHEPGLAGARGYTPFGVEIAKDAPAHDLKEFWHIGRDLPGGHALCATMPPNIWPDRPAEFRAVFSTLFGEFDRIGAAIMRHVAQDLGLPCDWFTKPLADSNSVLRLLHYPPVSSDPGKALRAGPHEDINLITLLLGAEEAGLELLARNGNWLAVEPPDGAMVVNVGDMLQRLTNHVLPSTTHRVCNPTRYRASHSRHAMPFFVHPRSDFLIETLPFCAGPDNPDRYPQPISADAYLQERLVQIGLRAQAQAEFPRDISRS